MTHGRREKRAQEFFNGLLMAHDNFVNLGLDVAKSAREVGYAGHFGRRRLHSSFEYPFNRHPVRRRD